MLMLKKNTYKQIKYKKYIRLRSEIPITNKLRILNFKRPKWNLLKKNIYRTIQLFRYAKRFRKKRFLNKFYFQLGYKLPWFYKSYKKNYFKQILIAKVNFFYFYSLKTAAKKIKKKLFSKKNSKSFDLLSFIEARPDIVLWRSGFCLSPAIGRFMINHNKLFINNIRNNISSRELCEGDLLRFENNINKNSLKSFFDILFNDKFIFLKERVNFVNNYNLEVNWNTMEIIFLGSQKQINNNILLPKYLNLYRVKKYLKLL